MKFITASLLALSLAAGSVFASDEAKLESVVSIDLGPTLLGFASKCAKGGDAEAAEAIRNLKHVRVRVFEGGDRSLAELQKAVKAQAKIQLDSSWERIVTVNKPSEGLVEIHVKPGTEDYLDGVVITVASPEKEGVLVEIEGQIRADQIQKVVGNLNIEGLPKSVATSAEKI